MTRMKVSIRSVVRSRQLLDFASLLAFLACGRLSAQNYTITELPPLAGHTATAAYAINESGQVAGDSGSRATIWTNGVPRDIQTIPTAYSIAYALNNSGHAAGDTTTAGNSSVFVWNGNVMERLILPAGQTAHGAQAMNDSGTLVGFGGPTGGFRWNAGSYLSLGLLPGDAYAVATAINGFGLIVGYAGTNSGAQPRLWVGTSPQALSLPESATNGAVFGINDLGDAVGWYLTPEFYRRPFIWSPSLGARSLPLPPGAADAPATTINDAGVITGYIDGHQ